MKPGLASSTCCLRNVKFSSMPSTRLLLLDPKSCSTSRVVFSPNTVVSPTIRTVGFKAGIDRGCSHSLATIRCQLHSRLLKSSRCISTAQTPTNWWEQAGAFLDCALVVLPCTFSDLLVTFHGRHVQAQGNPRILVV